MIEAVDETGAVLPEAISPGASAELAKDFTTGQPINTCLALKVELMR